MTLRLPLLLLLAVLSTAFYLVHIQYQSRKLYTELYRAQSEARTLETEFERLQVEKRAQATPLRIEKLAKDQIKMRSATPALTQYVREDGTVIAAVAPKAVAAGALASGAAHPAPAAASPGRLR